MGTTHTQQLSDGSIWLNSGWHIFPIDVDLIGVRRQIVAEKKTCKHMRYVKESYELSTVRSRKGNTYPTLIHRRKSYNVQGRRDEQESVERCISAPLTEDDTLTRFLDTAFQFTFIN
jgi:hypothetical protein